MSLKKKTQMNKDAMLVALEEYRCIVTAACKSVGICRRSHYEWYKDDDVYREAVDELDNTAIDHVESKLHSLINEGDTTATIFYLKTRGRKRGYNERTEITGANGKPISIAPISFFDSED